jgi:hypothetical protein
MLYLLTADYNLLGETERIKFDIIHTIPWTSEITM